MEFFHPKESEAAASSVMAGRHVESALIPEALVILKVQAPAEALTNPNIC